MAKPKIGQFKVGDRVFVEEGGELPFFDKLDFAVLTFCDRDGDWWGRVETPGRETAKYDGSVCLTQFGKIKLAPLPVDSSILLKAHELVNGDRAKAYGDCSTNFQRWSDLLKPLDIHLSPYQLALVMVAGKLARQTHAQKEDNLVDAAGYLEIAHKLAPK